MSNVVPDRESNSPEHEVDIKTRDGMIKPFITHPEEGGPYPIILFLMDAPGKREELHDMARRIATTGYVVMLPREPLIKWIFSSGQGREDWRKVVNMLYINNFLEFRPDADLAEIDFNQRFPSLYYL